MEKDENKSLELKRENTQGNLGALRYFSDDTNFVFILKKTEKLASAIYLITGFFDEEEPLKWNLRTLSSKILSSSLKLKDTESTDKEKAIMDIESTILEIGSLLLVAKNSGLMSEMNYNIISKEFNTFADTLASQSRLLKRGGSAALENNYFAVSVPEVRPRQGKVIEESVNEPIRDNTEKATYSYEPKLDVLENLANGHREDLSQEKGQKLDEGFMARGIKQGIRKEVGALKEFGAVAVKKNSRQSIIISLLRRKKEIMIKDVSPLIHGCSEKTIQRELLTMVGKGILKKQGEKRWSRYSLA